MNKQFLRSKKVYAVTKQLVPLKTELHEIGPSEEKKKINMFSLSTEKYSQTT